MMSDLTSLHEGMPACHEDQPLIALVDTSIFDHPGLLGQGRGVQNAKRCCHDRVSSCPQQIKQSECELPPAGVNARCEVVEDFDKDNQHGTYMAGILVGQNRPESRFLGIAPDARLRGVDWKKQPAMITDAVNQAWFETANPIFVFANTFVPTILKDRESLQPRERLGALPVKRMIDTSFLWIVAAGQVKEDEQTDPAAAHAETDKKRIHLTASTNLFPMNLGDFDNVVVVTACEDCLKSSRRIWEQAYTGDPGMIHVAAPGGNPVASMATRRRYAALQGTSPAAAFVAGVAARMRSCYPRLRAWMVKRWLQVTARPVFDPSVTTGVVDPVKALCDPTVSWLRTSEDVAGGECGESVDRVEWCHGSLEIVTVNDEPLKIDSSSILRLGRSSIGVDGSQWFAYVKGEPAAHGDWRRSLAQVRRQDPFIPVDPSAMVVKIVRSPGDDPGLYSFDDFSDLLLAEPVGVGACG
jgi:hypothetical protein